MGSKLFVYADDILLYKPVANESCYRDHINKISMWSRNNLNISKYKCMLLSNTHCPTLKLDGEVVTPMVLTHSSNLLEGKETAGPYIPTFSH